MTFIPPVDQFCGWEYREYTIETISFRRRRHVSKQVVDRAPKFRDVIIFADAIDRPLAWLRQKFLNLSKVF